MKVNNKREKKKVDVRLALDESIHTPLMIEKQLSKSKGKEKTLPEIISDRLARDLKNHPVQFQAKKIG